MSKPLHSFHYFEFPRMISHALPSSTYKGICGGTFVIVVTFFYNLTAPSRNFDFSYSATPGHENSLAFTLLNPKRYPTEQDSFSLRIPKRDLRAGISDDEILARFARGFFGGWVFTLERWFFLLTQFSLMDHDGKIDSVFWLALNSDNSCLGFPAHGPYL